MTSPGPDHAFAFRTLERRLASRRLAAFDLRARVTASLLIALVSGFAYWQMRIPLDGVHRAHGVPATAELLAAVLGAFALAAAAIAAARQAAIAARVPGPEWLALPVPPARVARHLLTESRLPAYGAFPPALAVIVAGAGLVPWWWLLLLAVAFAVTWLEATRVATALARRMAAPAGGAARGLPVAVRLLAAGPSRPRGRSFAAPRWRQERAWRALVRLDALVSRRPSAARTRLGFAAALFALGALAWFSEAPAVLRRAQSFACFLPAAAALGAWSIARACGDPAPAMRPLPLSLSDVWRARFTPVAAVLLAAAVLDSALAHGLPPGARLALVPAWWLPGAAVAALGLHYALTLAPRANAAENLYFGWLGVALSASVMIPFLGWGVLIAGVVHSARRLPRWWRPEPA